MTLNQLRFFFELASCCNFSKAAENLYTSQSNLSKNIAAMERELGVSLFDRSTHHCAMTAAGYALFSRTSDLFNQLNKQINNIRTSYTKQFSLVHVGVPIAERLPRFLEDFCYEANQNSTSIRYLVCEDSYITLIDKLLSFDYDIIFTPDRNARMYAGVEYIKIAPLSMFLAINRRNEKAASDHLAPGDCNDEFIFVSLPDGDSAPTDRVRDFYKKIGENLKFVILPTAADVLDSVRMGAGIAIVPDTVDQELYPDIKFFEFDKRESTSYQALLWRKGEENPAVLKLIAEASQHIE